MMDGGLKRDKPKCSSYGICHYSSFYLSTSPTTVIQLAVGVSMICTCSELLLSDTGHQAPESRIDLWTFRNTKQNVVQYKDILGYTAAFVKRIVTVRWSCVFLSGQKT
jgi:hypothetical protein